MNELIAALEDDIIRCMKCGMCHAHDPMYLESLDESVGARGQIQLVDAVAKENLELTDEFIDRMFTCVNCYACVENCPTSTPVMRILEGARAEIFRAFGIEKLRELYGCKVGEALAVSTTTRTRAQVMAEVIATQLDPGTVWQDVLGSEGDSALIADNTLLETVPDPTPRSGKKRAGLFVCCVTNLAAPEIGHAAIRVLEAAGYDVVVPKDQKCCGSIFASVGDVETAKGLAQKNAEIFSAADLDVIVTECAACGTTLKLRYADWIGAEGQTMAEKTKDISELLATDGLTGTRPVDKRVAYTDACQLASGQKIKAQPRTLLKSIPGAEVVELTPAAKCCGAGEGAFAFFKPELSAKLTADKVASIRDSGADLIATGCPVSVLHLNEALGRAGVATKARHTVQVLAESLE